MPRLRVAPLAAADHIPGQRDRAMPSPHGRCAVRALELAGRSS